MIVGRCLRSSAHRVIVSTMKAPVVLPDGARTLLVVTIDCPWCVPSRGDTPSKPVYAICRDAWPVRQELPPRDTVLLLILAGIRTGPACFPDEGTVFTYRDWPSSFEVASELGVEGGLKKLTGSNGLFGACGKVSSGEFCHCVEVVCTCWRWAGLWISDKEDGSKAWRQGFSSCWDNYLHLNAIDYR